MADTRSSDHSLISAGEGGGEIRVADEVVAVIAGIAVTEVDGVECMAGGITGDMVGRLGIKNLAKGIRVEIIDNEVRADVSVIIKNNGSMKEISENIQERVRTAVESMTGLKVVVVNVRVAGVTL